VFGGNGHAPAAGKKAAKKEPKPWNNSAAKGKKQVHRKQDLYTVIDGSYAGHELKGVGVSKMLKAGTLEFGTHLSHPVKGNLAVVGDLNDLHLLPVNPALLELQP
jgi:hypothetical protein